MDNVMMNEPVNGVAMMKPGQSPSPSPSPTPIASPVLMGAQSKNATDSAPVEPISNTHTKTGELEDGLPDTLNVAELAGHVSKLPVARRMTSKGQLGRLSKGVTPSAISKLRTTGPCPGYKAEQLNSKQTRFLILLTMQVYRHQFGQKCVEAHRPEDLIEVWLINRWLKARHPKSPSIIGPEMLEIGSRAMGISGLETPSVLSGEDALIAALSVKVTKTGFDKTLRAMIAQGWVRDMYQDICEDNEHADRAASAVFAIASMVNCRWPLELVHQKSPEMHWKHYRSMETRELAKDGWPIIRTEFTPSSLKLASPGSEAIFNLIALRPLLDFAGEGLSALGDDLSTVDSETKDHSIEEVRSGFSLMTRSAEILESVSSIFQDRLTTMAAATVNEALVDLIRTTEALHSRFRNTFTEFDRDDNQTIEHIQSAQKAIANLADDFSGTVPGREGDLMAATTEAGNRISGKEPVFVKLMEAGDSIRDDITKLAAEDPLRNREEISRCYDRLKDMDPELTAANVEMGFWAQEAGRLANQEIEAWQAHNRRIESEQAAEDARHQSEHEVAQLLEETVAENKDLSSRNLELKARVESLENGLASQRNAQANEGMSDEVREAMQAEMAGGNTLTPEQALLLVKATYPHTEILDSAWSSAHDAAQFEQTDRLWENLSTLAGKYTDAITGGTSDAEARKLFTGYEYAANESETCSAGALRKHREFWYQGEKRFFDQHLKIGAAFDARKTIRIHFKIIDGVLVIAYCGEHRKL